MRKQVNIFNYISGVQYLGDYFEEMRTGNPRLSLRSFATKLGLDQSTLSRYFAGERHISSEKAAEIALRLKLDESESQYLKLLFLLGDRGEKELLEKLKLSFLYEGAAQTPSQNCQSLEDLTRILNKQGKVDHREALQWVLRACNKFETADVQSQTCLIPIKKENRTQLLKALQNLSVLLKQWAVEENADDIFLVSSFMVNMTKIS